MASKIGTVRTAYKDTIETKQGSGGYVRNDFTLEEAVKPHAELPELSTPKVTVIGAGFRKDYTTRGWAGRMIIPIYVAFQKLMTDSADVAEMDEMLELVEQVLEDATTVQSANYRLESAEQLLDENELPYSFQRLREKSLFETYMIANFRYTES